MNGMAKPCDRFGKSCHSRTSAGNGEDAEPGQAHPHPGGQHARPGAYHRAHSATVWEPCAVIGSLIRNAVPLPSSLATSMLPPCASTMLRA
jgi:hypothetical protein